MTDTTRRAFMAGSATAAVAVALPAVAMATTGDAAILAAWERRVEAFNTYDALPYSDDGGTTYTPEEQAQWDIVDEAEKVIQTTAAKTPQGVAIQVWTALSNRLSQRVDEAAVRRRDLAYFAARECDLDSDECLLLAALRSLESMGR